MPPFPTRVRKPGPRIRAGQPGRERGPRVLAGAGVGRPRRTAESGRPARRTGRARSERAEETRVWWDIRYGIDTKRTRRAGPEAAAGR